MDRAERVTQHRARNPHDASKNRRKPFVRSLEFIAMLQLSGDESVSNSRFLALRKSILKRLAAWFRQARPGMQEQRRPKHDDAALTLALGRPNAYFRATAFCRAQGIAERSDA
jgi:hypothetical protein